MKQEEQPEVRTFFAETRFERMARRPGGISREQALERAQSEVNSLKPAFSNWLDTELEDLATIARNLRGTQTDAVALEQLYRSSTQLQNIGATMGYPLITVVATNLCEVLGSLKNGAPLNQAVIDCHLNALFLARQDNYRDLQSGQVAQVIDGLKQILQLSVASQAKP